MSGSSYSILAVDDVEANLTAIRAVLDGMGCTIVCARSGNEALRLLLKQEFALLLLDVQMPGMDGYEVAQYVRENPSTHELPIIFLTATHHTEDGMLRGYGTGAVDVIFKPLNPTVLRCKVRVFLDLYAARRRLANLLGELGQANAALRAEAEARVALLDELRRKNEELEAFSYSVSHDLRAPVRHVDGFSAALLEEYADKLDAQGLQYLDRVRAASHRMGQLIDDLLSLSRIGRAELVRRPEDLSAIAHAVAAELQRDSTRSVRFDIADGLTASVDRRLMLVVFENLLGNAWKFTAKVAEAHIEVGIEEQGGRRVFFVRDNGAGFEMAYAKRLFSPFQRLHAQEDFAGTGIGLATVHRIIDRHGGRIWAEAAVGEGARFLFTLGAP
jgi:two-component system, sensor histidine kinase and response regulator